MTFIQVDEKTWMVPMRRSAITGKFLLKSKETTEQILERLEGYYREDD